MIRLRSTDRRNNRLTRTTERRLRRKRRQARLEALEDRRVLACTGAPTEVFCESFENAAPNYDSGMVSFEGTDAPFFDNASGYYIRTDGTNPAISDPGYTGEDGSFYFAAEDTDDAPNNEDDQTMLITGINISGHTGLTVSGLFAAGAAFSDAPPVDQLSVEYSVDSSPFTVGLCYNHANPSGALIEDADCNGSTSPPSGPTTLTTTFAFDSFAIPNGGTLDLRITIKADSAGEDVAFDEIKVTGTPAATNQAPIVAGVNAPNVGEPEIGNSSYDFTVTYSDDSAIDASTLDTSDVTVTPQGGGGALTVANASFAGGNGTPKVVTYTVTPPGGTWDASDNDTYDIAVVTGQVCDDDGSPLCVAAGNIGSFNVNATNTPPTVNAFLAEDVIFPDFGQTSYSFTIEYTDVGGVDASSIDASDVTVTDPGAVPLTVTSGSTTDPNGTTVTATYTVTPPGGSWDSSDVGTPYTIAINASQVFDVAGAAVAADPSLTTFQVLDTKLLNESFETDGLGTRYTSSVTPFNDGAGDHWDRGTNADFALDNAHSNIDGQFYWGAEDINATPDGDGSEVQSLTFNTINIAGHENLVFVGSFGATTFNFVEPDDRILVTYSVDGGAPQNLIRFSPDGNDDMALDTDFNGVGDSTLLGPAFQNFAVSSVIPNGSTLDLTIEVKADEAGEEVAFDNFMITGDVLLVDNPPAVSGFSVDDVGEPEIGQTSYSFDITYTDGSNIDASTLDANDVTVTPQGGGAALVVTNASFAAGNAPTKTVTYTVTPPGGSWDASDNDTYDIEIVANEVGDDATPTQQYVPAGLVTSFVVDATNTLPTVTDFLVEDVIFTDFGETAYAFTIEYTDVGGVDVSTIDAGDVTVTGPGGPLTVVSGTEASGTDGSPKTGTYTVTPPGGTWDTGDVGTYTIELVASEVFDINGASVAGASPLTTFDVIATKLLNETFETDGLGTRYTSSVTPFNDGASDHWDRGTNADFDLVTPHTNVQGKFYWGAEDVDALPDGDGSDVQSLSFATIDISSHTNLAFMGLFGATTSNFSDPDDRILVQYEIDGGGFVNLLQFAPTGVGGPMALDTDFNGVGDGASLTAAFAPFSGAGSIPDGNNLDLRIEVKADEAGEEVAFDSLMVTGDLANTAPTVAADNDPATVNEGDTATNTGTFSDPDTGDVVSVTASVGTLTQTGTQSGSWSWSFGTLDGPDDSQTVTVTATDSDGAFSTTTFQLIVNNVAPSVAADNDPVTVNEGDTATNTGTFSDPGLDVVSVTASVGTLTQTGTQSGSWSWSFGTLDGPDDSQTVTVTATDSDGAFSTTTFQLIVNNVAPSVAADNDPVTVNEGDTATNTGTFSDPGLDVVSVTASVGTLTQTGTQSGSWSWSFGTLDGPDDSQTVTVTATDSDGAFSTTTFQLIVNNVAPSVAADNDPVTVNEGDTATNTGTFSDPGLDVVSVTASVGTLTQTGTQSGSWSWSFGTLDGPDDSQTVTVTATDSDGAFSTTTFQLIVNNVAPSVAADNDPVTVNEGDIATNTGTFSDPGLDVVSVTASVGTLTQTGTQSGSWSWSFGTLDGPDDSQTVTVTATDSDGAFSTTTFQLIVNNVAPSVAADNDPVTVNEGDTATNTGTFSDPGLDVVSVTASVGIVTQVGTQSGTWSWSFLTTDNNDSQLVTITATDSDGAFFTTTFQLDVVNLPPQVSASPASQTVQYSDLITTVTITATDVPADPMNSSTEWSDNGGLTFTSGLPDAGSLEPNIGLVFSGAANQISPASWTLSGIADLAPGDYIIRVNVADDDGGVGFVDVLIDVQPEDAVATYTGPTFVGADSNGDAILPLLAVVEDITALDPGTDPDGGNITTATVTFDLSGDVNQTITVPVNLLDTDIKLGVASFDLALSNVDNPLVIQVDVIVGGFYTGGDDQAVVTVAPPTGNFITGGGYYFNDADAYLNLENPTNNQPYQLADGGKTNFGFNVKYNKKLTNLQGKLNLILRTDDGRTLQIKTNNTQSLGVDPDAGVDGAASFVAKANITDITDPLNPISLGGNKTLIANMTDNGEPGSNTPNPDTISFAVWDGNVLLYANGGLTAQEQPIDGGNLDVHTRGNGNGNGKNAAVRIEQPLPGDANGDGVFNSSDLVRIFQAGKYDRDIDAVFSEGDFNGDRRFDSGDLVLALQEGQYGDELLPDVASALDEDDLLN